MFFRYHFLTDTISVQKRASATRNRAVAFTRSLLRAMLRGWSICSLSGGSTGMLIGGSSDAYVTNFDWEVFCKLHMFFVHNSRNERFLPKDVRSISIRIYQMHPICNEFLNDTQYPGFAITPECIGSSQGWADVTHGRLRARPMDTKPACEKSEKSDSDGSSKDADKSDKSDKSDRGTDKSDKSSKGDTSTSDKSSKATDSTSTSWVKSFSLHCVRFVLFRESWECISCGSVPFKFLVAPNILQHGATHFVVCLWHTVWLRVSFTPADLFCTFSALQMKYSK